MRKLTAAMLTACLVLLSHLSVVQADILGVIPEKSLAAVVTRNVDEAEGHLREMIERLGGEGDELGKQRLIDVVLGQFKIPQRTDPDTGAVINDCTVDSKGPLALVVVTPAFDVRGMPMGLVVKVGQYKKLLQEIGDALGAAGPEVTPDGTDVLKGETGTVYAAQVGAYAVVADAEYVIRTFKAEANKSLAVSSVAAIRDTYSANDLAVYVNFDEAIKTFAPQINAFKQMIQQQMKNQPQQEGMAMPPEQMGRIVAAEIDFLMKLFLQTDAGCIGAKFGPEGARLRGVYQAVSDTTLARLAAKVTPARLSLLDTLDGPSLAAAGWYVSPELMDELTKAVGDFFVEAGFMADEDKLKAFVKSYKDLMKAASGQGAFLWAPPDEGTGLLRFAYLFSVKPNTDIRGVMKDYVEQSAVFLEAFQGPVTFENKLEEGVETYRRCVIDRTTLTFQQNPDAPEPLDPNKDMMKMIEAMYGPALVSYVTQARDTAIYTMGYPTADVLKAQVDRILDGKPGSVMRSGPYQGAVKGLPANRSGVFVYSPALMLKTMMPKFMAAAEPGAHVDRLNDLKVENPSGVGVSFGPTGKGIAVDVNVPMQEMQNMKKLFIDIGEKMRPPADAAEVE